MAPLIRSHENAIVGTIVGVTAFSDDADGHRHDYLLTG